MLDRRRMLALGAAGALAGCGPDLLTRARARPIDKGRLAQGFPALAERARPGVLALGVLSLADAEQTWISDLAHTFPLAGAVAAPIAAAMLAMVDAGQQSLAQRIGFAADDLSPPFSLIDQRWPDPPQGRAATIRLSGLATLALQQGDNTAIDVLMREAGGPGAVTAFLEMKHVTGLTVDRYQRTIDADLFGMPSFRPDWKDAPAFDAARELTAPSARLAAMRAFAVDKRDATTVPAALGFLAALSDGELVSPPSTAQLLAWMETARGRRFGPGFPDQVRLAQAGGATPTDLGFTAATCNLAIATYPDATQYALAGFLVGSTAAEDARDALFADAARLLAGAIGG
jgi:beta-lactamase class A